MVTSDQGVAIGEAARQSGMPASTLRYWESQGLLAAPGRVAGKRLYDTQALQRLSLVVLLKRAGFTLKEIRIVLSGVSSRTRPPEIWRELAEQKLPEVRTTLAQLRATEQILETGLRCECLTLQDCLVKAGQALAPN